MSGGVDSSVAAWLLQQQGEQTVGVTMRLFTPEELAPGQGERCHILEDIQYARAVAAQLGIPHHALDLSLNYGIYSFHDVSALSAFMNMVHPCLISLYCEEGRPVQRRTC